MRIITDTLEIPIRTISLFISDTGLKHKSVQMYKLKRNESKIMIDAIVYDKKMRKLGTDTGVMREFECGRDLFLVMSRVDLVGREEWTFEEKE